MGLTLHRSLLCGNRFILLWMIASLTGIASASSESLAKSSSVAVVAATLMWHAAPTLAQDNLALRKPATQISGLQRLGPAAAVDGNMNTPSCTTQQTNTWWSVDLGAQYDIATVNVTSYTDSNDRNLVIGLINFKVVLSNTAPSTSTTTATPAAVEVECGEQSGPVTEATSQTFSIDCPAGQTFQHVIIRGSQTISAELCMDEVEVFARETTTVTTVTTTSGPSPTTAAGTTTTGPVTTQTASATTTAADADTTTTSAATTTTATTQTTESSTASAPSSTVPLAAALITLGALYGAAAIGVCCFVSIPRYLARRRAMLGVENVIVEEVVHQPPPQQFYPEPPPPPFQRGNYWPQRRRYY